MPLILHYNQGNRQKMGGVAMEKTKEDMEKLREELKILLNNQDSYFEGKVLEVSQELDNLIYEYMNHFYE